MNVRSGKITGTGAVVKLSSALPLQSGATSSSAIKAKFVQVLTEPGNSASVLIGGAEVSSTVGYPIPPGWAGQMFPPIAELTAFYDLSLINVYMAVGDVLDIIYGG